MNRIPEVISLGTGRPRLALIGGIHGNERSGRLVAARMLKSLRASRLRGRLIVIPNAYPAASALGTREGPDGLNLNRCFPGNPNGCETHRIADIIWRAAASADCVIDLHGSKPGSAPYSLSLHAEYPAVRALAQKLPLPAVLSAGTPGQLFVEACRRGQPSLIVEFPDNASAVDLVCAALMQLLSALDIADVPFHQPFPGFFGRIARGTDVPADAFCVRRENGGFSFAPKYINGPKP